MPPLITHAEYLEINGVPLATPAWRILDLSQLFDGPAVLGSNRVIPGAGRVLTFPRQRTERKLSLPLGIWGDSDQNGTPASNQRLQMEQNLKYLLDHVVGPVDSGDGTRSATFHTLLGNFTDSIVVESPLGPTTKGVTNMITTLTIILPSGSFLI